MGLYVKNNKYYCEHRDCPYKYCPWKNKGVNVDKTDFSAYQEEAGKQGWVHLPYNNKEAEFCTAYMDG